MLEFARAHFSVKLPVCSSCVWRSWLPWDTVSFISGLFVSVGRCPKILGLSAFRGGSGTAKPLGWVGSWRIVTRGPWGAKAGDCDGSKCSGAWEQAGDVSQKSFSQLESCRGNRNFSKERLLDCFNPAKAIQSLSITEKMTELLCKQLAWKRTF